MTLGKKPSDSYRQKEETTKKTPQPRGAYRLGNLMRNRINEDATIFFRPYWKTVSFIRICSTASQSKCTYCTGTLDIIYTLDGEKNICCGKPVDKRKKISEPYNYLSTNKIRLLSIYCWTLKTIRSGGEKQQWLYLLYILYQYNIYNIISSMTDAQLQRYIL